MAAMAGRTQTWPVPYLSKLEGGGLQPGQSVLVRGMVLGKRFDINLTAGPHVETEGQDVPFHMSVRQDEKKFVLNTLKGGKWEKEERHTSHFKEGEPFDIRIRAHDNKFEIYANQKELCTYAYRAPLNAINHLFITGECELHAVNWGGKYYPVPYQANIDGGLTPGKRIFISGVPEMKKTKRFHVNLVAKNADVVLHINPRFDEKVIVRNSCIAGLWGNEEREGKLHLEKDVAFDMIIANESYAFQVFINGAHFCSYAHRMEPNSIASVQIEGDVELQGVHVK